MPSLAVDHAGRGGTPLLLVHSWPETRRIWKRNLEPLARAGFEVIAPNLRGFGDSPPAADDRYDVAAHSADLRELVRETLGHEQVTVCAGDLGGAIAQDMSLRYPGLVGRLCRALRRRRAHGGGVPRPGRTVRGARRGALPAVGAGRSVERRAALALRVLSRR